MDTFSLIVDLIFCISRYIWNVNVPKGLSDRDIWFCGTFGIFCSFGLLVHLKSKRTKRVT